MSVLCWCKDPCDYCSIFYRSSDSCCRIFYKIQGIAKDIFGSEENYVIPIEQIKEENKLTQAFIWLQGNENHIKEHLKKRMPQYIKDAEK